MMLSTVIPATLTGSLLSGWAGSHSPTVADVAMGCWCPLGGLPQRHCNGYGRHRREPAGRSDVKRERTRRAPSAFRS